MSRRTTTLAAMVVLLAVAVALVIALARDANALAERNDQLRRLATRAHPGMYVPMHEATDIEGKPVTLGAPGPDQRQLLFFLTTSCPYCRATLPVWKDLAREAERTGKATAIGVALDSAHLVGPYVEEHGLEFPVVVLEDRRALALYRANRVPFTIVVDGAGRVLHARPGELMDPVAIDSVRRALADPSSWEEAPPPSPVSTASGTGNGGTP